MCTYTVRYPPSFNTPDRGRHYIYDRSLNDANLFELSDMLSGTRVEFGNYFSFEPLRHVVQEGQQTDADN